MALWGNVDNAANSAIFALAQVSKNTANSTERTNLYNNTTANAYFTGVTVGQFGINSSEEQAMGAAGLAKPAHAGWALRTEGSGGRAGRVFYETLVAMGSMTGDGSDDTVAPDYRVTITLQPVNTSNGTGNAATLIVGAATVPTGGTLSYQWKRNGADITNGGIYSGATSNTLTISNINTISGNSFNVFVTAPGASNLSSQTVTVTVV